MLEKQNLLLVAWMKKENKEGQSFRQQMLENYENSPEGKGKRSKRGSGKDRGARLERSAALPFLKQKCLTDGFAMAAFKEDDRVGWLAIKDSVMTHGRQEAQSKSTALKIITGIRGDVAKVVRDFIAAKVRFYINEFLLFNFFIADCEIAFSIPPQCKDQY